MFDLVRTRTHIPAPQDRARLYFRTWAKIGRDATSSISEQTAEMSTAEKVIDLDTIRQRLDRLGVRL
jgi:hypothetical protein